MQSSFDLLDEFREASAIALDFLPKADPKSAQDRDYLLLLLAWMNDVAGQLRERSGGVFDHLLFGIWGAQTALEQKKYRKAAERIERAREWSFESGDTFLTYQGRRRARFVRNPKNANATQVNVRFATNRALDRDYRYLFSNAPSSAEAPVSLGIASVSVPETHKESRMERPAWWKLEFVERLDRHIVIEYVQPMQEKDWLANSKATKDDGLLFVHGYNVSFDEAVRRTAQIAFDLNFSGMPLCFSWASAASVMAYAADEETAAWSVPHLRAVMQLARTKLGLRRLHIIAHSMGNRILASALASPADTAKDQCPLGRVVLAAADLDVRKFAQLKVAFERTELTTSYASRADRALLVSRELHKSNRLGDASPPYICDDMETIDVTAAGADMFGLGHGYIAANRSIFKDLFYVIRHDIRAKDRASVRRTARGHFVLA